MRRTARSAIAGVVLATAAAAQPEPAADSRGATDWRAAVEKAVAHSRYAVRRAAAGEIARAGDAAVDAIRAHAEQHGDETLPLTLVDAIARSDAGGPATEALLFAWARNREFYWRAQALDGLARRAERGDLIPVFHAAIGDPAWLYRVAGARGLMAVGDPPHREIAANLLGDDDPRVRLRIGLLLLEQGDPRAPGVVLHAFGRDAHFLDDPWGKREEQFALGEVRRITGRDFDLAATDAAARDAARREFLTFTGADAAAVEAARAASGEAVDAVVGIEVRSCRNGDLFVRADATGRVWTGLDPLREVALDEGGRARTRKLLGRVAIPGTAVHGNVVCDYIRVFVRDPLSHHKAAPGALPAALELWLKEIVATLEEDAAEARTGAGEAVAAAIAGRLGQFTTRSD